MVADMFDPDEQSHAVLFAAFWYVPSDIALRPVLTANTGLVSEVSSEVSAAVLSSSSSTGAGTSGFS